ncbi:MAG TPA: TfoX/Sxy family DNA transformation protein [Burkholderiaceae bacterium]|nr:TfoX/Sxy family DNA transformation protein [Burkholderiaceae bacterium]
MLLTSACTAPPQAPPGPWRNLGPRSRELLARAGVHTHEELVREDALELYVRLKALDARVSLNMLYALVGAQEGLDWREVQRERRTELLLRLEDLGHAPR